MVKQNTLIQGGLAGLCLCYIYMSKIFFNLCYFNFLYFSKESDNHPMKVFSSSSSTPDTLHGLITYCYKNIAEENIGKRLPSRYFFFFQCTITKQHRWFSTVLY